MADVGVTDGMTRVAYVPAVANTAAPTTAELGAGGSLLLTPIMTPDGLIGFEPTTASVDNSSLASTFDTVTIGRDSYGDSGVRLKKQVDPDTAYTTLTRGTTGYIVIRRDVTASTAWTSGQAVEVYPIICGKRKRLAPERNTMTRYEVPMMISNTPNTDAVVA